MERELASSLAPGLYIVSTPIGNLADISLRALATLANADMVFCEDTRHSRKLFTHFGISRKLDAYHDHNAAKERPRILARLRAGQSVAVIADAGTPLVSDPGNKLVREARDAGLPVYAVPGASAALAALASTGLPTDRFFFEGFLPPKSAARRKRLETLKSVPSTLVFYEAPSRLDAMLADLADILGDREGAIAKELTKLHETVLRAPLNELAESTPRELGSRGEFVILAAPPAAAEISDADVVVALERSLAAGDSSRDAVKNVTEALGVPRNRVYKLALGMKEQAT